MCSCCTCNCCWSVCSFPNGTIQICKLCCRMPSTLFLCDQRQRSETCLRCIERTSQQLWQTRRKYRSRVRTLLARRTLCSGVRRHSTCTFLARTLCRHLVGLNWHHEGIRPRCKTFGRHSLLLCACCCPSLTASNSFCVRRVRIFPNHMRRTAPLRPRWPRRGVDLGCN